ncbi:hypothetical protein [Clostridium sp. C2-6-12]|uniref:hypothetical protein n=1 Tax=Clostridium sp. C2-6-12 TaxID=2698832 RepID=UPI00136EF929|nr:hypothetical protein [Clostridium sp. C2-6-12]
MKIEICITNLGNGNYIYGNVYSLYDIIDLEKKVNPLRMNDTEDQLKDTDVNVSDRDSLSFFEMLGEFKITPDDLSALFKVGTASEVLEILEYQYSYQIIGACNKETAFQE